MEVNILLNRKFIILATVIVLFFSFSAAYAAENNTIDEICVDENQAILEENDGIGNFSDLSALIENTPEGGILELDTDYQYDSSSGALGVNITKSITVDGKDHILDAKNSSRIFNVRADNVVLKNIVFKNGFSNNAGGAIYTNSNCSAVNCNFEKCWAANEGGAVYSNHSFTAVNCSFDNNFAYFGGSLFNCLAVNCNFTNNSANSGGALYDSSAIGSRFKNSNARDGGAISVQDYNYVISECSFINCSADTVGGAISFGINSQGTIENCIFEDGTSEKGGAIYIFTSADIKNCSFTNNGADEGGAIGFSSIAIGSVNDCIFANNRAAEGGAIHIFTSVEVNDCRFTDNSADLGGGIYFNDSNCLITDSVFTNSSIFSENQVNMHNVTVDGEIFNTKTVGNFSELSSLIKRTPSGNTLNLYKDYQNDDAFNEIVIFNSIRVDGKGHTIDANKKSRIFSIGTDEIPNGDVFLKNIIFKNGYSNDDGGAVYYCNTNALGTVFNCSFVDCFASGSGGAVKFAYTESKTVSNCSFVNCRAGGSGGALDISNGEHFDCRNIVEGCSFVNCSANEGGGAICVDTDDGFSILDRINNCRFIDCSAKDGGSINFYFNSKDAAAINCSFTHSNAKNNGGAVYVSEFSKSRIMLSYFENNTAESAGAVFGGIVFDCELKNNSQPEIDSPDNYAEIVPKDIVSNQDGIVTLKFPKDAKGKIEVFVNGNSKLTADVKDGAAKIDLSKSVGNHMVTFKYSGDANYTAFTKDSNATITVNPAKIVASNLSVLYSSGKTYKITVYKKAGIKASGVNVVVKLNDKSFKTLKTNSKGIVSFKITQSPGTYKIKITSLKRDVTKTLTVKHIVVLKTATVKKSAKKLILTASLSKINNKYLKNKQITFKFDGKKYSAKTNSKGVAKVTIKSSVLKKLKVGKKVTYQATYNKDTVKKTVKVKK